MFAQDHDRAALRAAASGLRISEVNPTAFAILGTAPQLRAVVEVAGYRLEICRSLTNGKPRPLVIGSRRITEELFRPLSNTPVQDRADTGVVFGTSGALVYDKVAASRIPRGFLELEDGSEYARLGVYGE